MFLQCGLIAQMLQPINTTLPKDPNISYFDVKYGLFTHQRNNLTIPTVQQAFFCRLEYKERSKKNWVYKTRLGNVDYVDKLELKD